MHHRHYPIIVFLLLLTGLSGSLKAQDGLNQFMVEDTSYAMYLRSDWKALSAYCEKAIDAGYDYYYLRMRAGIAYYERKQYRKAIIHFEKARAFNEDNVVKEYLYYSYLFSEQYEQAQWLSQSFDSTLASSTGTAQLKGVQAVSLQGGMKQTGDSAFKTAALSEIALTHRLGRRATMMHAVNFYGQKESRFNVKQFQYYANVTIPLKHNFKLSVASHLVFDHSLYTKNVIVYVNNPIPPGFPPPPPDSIKKHAEVRTVNSAQNSIVYVGAAGISKSFASFDLSIGSSVAVLDTATQYQGAAGISYFPFRNKRLSIGGNFYAHAESNDGVVRVASVPFLSAYLSSKLFVSAHYFMNSGANISEHNGYFINNSPDVTTSRAVGLLSHRFSKKVCATVTYGYETKKNIETNHSYHYNIVMAGILITP